MSLHEIKAVVFDLDGTLYQDLSFYRGYLSLLLEGTAWRPSLGRISEYASAVLRGETRLRMGGFFRRDTPPVASVMELFSAVSEENAGDNFDERFYSDDYIYLGDAWSVVMTVAALLDITPENRRRAFTGIRERMVAENTLVQSDRVFDAMRALRDSGVALYLFTNTRRESAVGFVEKLGLQAIVPHIEYGIEKPYGLRDRLPAIAENAGGADKVLSIGDHSFNDLSPAKASGAKTALISPYEIHDGIAWDCRVSTLGQLADLLERISAATAIRAN